MGFIYSHFNHFHHESSGSKIWLWFHEPNGFNGYLRLKNKDVPIIRLQIATGIGRLSTVLPIIFIGQIASDNNRHQPIIGADRLSAYTYYYLFIFRLDYWVIKSNKSNRITRFNKILLLCHYSTTWKQVEAKSTLSNFQSLPLISAEELLVLPFYELVKNH